MRSNEKQDKLLWADKLRAAAIIGVITVHSSASIPPLFGQIPDFIWWTGNIIDCLARFCVPVFVMLSGALLLRSNTPPAEFFRKRSLRIALPFLFWSLVYSLLQLGFKTGELWKMSLWEYLIHFWYQIYADNISYHFWYVYMIIGLYLLIPFIAKPIRKASTAVLLGSTGLWFLLIFCIDFFVADVHVPDVLRYVGYLPLGFYLGNTKMKMTTLSLPLGLIGLGFFLTTMGTFWFSAESGKFDPAFYGYATPNILIFSVGIFLLFKNVKWNQDKDVWSFISRYSFGIYLIHVLVLSQIKFNWLVQYPLFGILLITVSCLAISALVIFLLNKLPGGKYISG